MKRCGFTLWKWLASGAGLLIIAAILFPLFARAPRPSGGISCLNNLKQTSIGLQQYIQDFDENLPLIALSPTSTALDGNIPFEKKQFYGWADALHPYCKSTQILQCSTEGKQSSNALPTTRSYTDYWFNSNLSGLGINNRKNGMAQETIAFGDGNDGSDSTDARYNLPALPAAWINDQNSPAYRHIGAANYAFLDGHVKRLTPDQIVNGPAPQNQYTFSPKWNVIR